jgi:N-acyl-D-amino-acid deacylase
VFDPETVQDNATYENPHQLATGVMDVFVNGQQVIKDQQHTGAMPGRFIKGPGWKKAE